MPDDVSGARQAGLGALRWLVTLYRRDQAPADDMALQETLVPIATVHADIRPSYPSTFYQSTQIDGPVTHMVDIRWQDYPSTIDVVVRTTKRPTGGLRSELFRVRRSTEIAGRKRFIRMECELEHSRDTRDDSDATRNDVLTEPYGYASTGWDAIWDGGVTIWDTGMSHPLDRTAWDDQATAWDDGGTTLWDVPP